MNQTTQKEGTTKIGVFYDGNYFLHISNYYNYVHARKQRVSISGLHNFIRQQVSIEEDTDVRRCRIVDAHYFRGRLNAQDASQKGNLLYYDRVFDEILNSEGVVTHYLPIRTGFTRQEKGVEVWLSLEAYELAHLKQFDVVALIGSDSDYVLLARKLAALGTRVMLISWEFEYISEEGQKTVTRTSTDLYNQVTYSLPMYSIIEGKVLRDETEINDLFVVSAPKGPNTVQGTPYPQPIEEVIVDGDVVQGEIHSLKSGYGFIKYPPNNLFFHYTSVLETEFLDLREGDVVEFVVANNEEGKQIARNVRVVEEDAY
jgi:cold shock CspA family protein/uncharacterized LabA/DUF88 family protein